MTGAEFQHEGDQTGMSSHYVGQFYADETG
jgi:hypothetical protein